MNFTVYHVGDISPTAQELHNLLPFSRELRPRDLVSGFCSRPRKVSPSNSKSISRNFDRLVRPTENLLPSSTTPCEFSINAWRHTEMIVSSKLADM